MENIRSYRWLDRKKVNIYLKEKCSAVNYLVWNYIGGYLTLCFYQSLYINNLNMNYELLVNVYL